MKGLKKNPQETYNIYSLTFFCIFLKNQEQISLQCNFDLYAQQPLFDPVLEV